MNNELAAIPFFIKVLLFKDLDFFEGIVFKF
jgi:hypothetical protein